MHEQDVLTRAHDFLVLMSQLSEPRDLCFRTFTTEGEGMDELCLLAQRVAKGGEDAISSLTIRPGTETSFEISGTHALAIMAEKRAVATRFVILSVLAAVLLVIILCICRRR